MELLAPAGAWESMEAAVQNGADSVYMGGRLHNARQFAGNFREDEEIARAIAYCHARGARVYITLNTLLLDRELQEAMDYAGTLYEAGADALIVQDMGLIRMLRAQLPGMELHASTQMGIHDEAGLALCGEWGVARAVLARELSLERIRQLSACDSGVALEGFAHGAMCTAVSGMCLLSSLAGGRSGNRGACAQPCRKAYALDGGLPGYPLSLQDLCMLYSVADLREAGISCIKLEGRMKRPEYVGAMTRAYRMALDGAEEAALQRELDAMRRIFDRGAAQGYYYHRQPPAEVPAGGHGGGAAEAQCVLERERYRKETGKRPVEGELLLHIGQAAALRLRLDGICVEARGNTVQAAQKPVDAQRYVAQAEKLGGTPFWLKACAVEMPAPAYVPVSELNGLRREAVRLLGERLAGRREPAPRLQAALPVPRGRNAQARPEILAIVPDAARARTAFSGGARMVALEPRDWEAAEEALRGLQGLRKQGCKLLLQLPAADLSGRLHAVWKHVFASGLVDGGVAQHPSQGTVIRGERIAGYLCNAANAQSVLQLQGLGFHRTLLSVELNKAQLRDLAGLSGIGVYAYGRVQLMQLWHCPRAARGGNPGGGGSCTGGSPGLLRDGEGREFPIDPVRCSSGCECLSRVRNCDTTDILDVLAEIPAPEWIALEFYDETERQMREILQKAAAYEQLKKAPLPGGVTRGHWARGWQHG